MMATFNINNSKIGQITDSGTNINNGQMFTSAELTQLQQTLDELRLKIEHSDAPEQDRTQACAAVSDVQQLASQPSPQNRLKLHEKIAVAVGMLTISSKLAEIADPYLPVLVQLQQRITGN